MNHIPIFSLIISRIPALLKISTEKNTVKRLKNDIKQLNHKLSQLQALLETKEAEIFRFRKYVCYFSDFYLLIIFIHAYVHVYLCSAISMGSYAGSFNI